MAQILSLRIFTIKNTKLLTQNYLYLLYFYDKNVDLFFLYYNASFYNIVFNLLKLKKYGFVGLHNMFSLVFNTFLIQLEFKDLTVNSFILTEQF